MKINYLAICLFLGTSTAYATARDLGLPNQPLFTQQAVSPLVMLVMGRDHTLYYEAYNDASDLDADGVLDTRFKPALKYFGLFDPNKCYTYDANNNDNAKRYFYPSGWASGELRTCPGSWSGNFLNYLTTSRIDALRKVLYGGKRDRTDTTKGDTASSTILIRSYIPEDAHSWGKVWDPDIDAAFYDIKNYTPLSSNSVIYHFANTSISDGGSPLLRIARLNNIAENGYLKKPWVWAGKERILANIKMSPDDKPDKPNNNVTLGYDNSRALNNNREMTDFTVRVEVCKSGYIFDPNRDNANEEGCKAYTDNTATYYKPEGVLQKFGIENSPNYNFGLISGSYQNNLSGGVLRKQVKAFTDEINSNGTLSNVNGIIKTIDTLKIVGFKYNWGAGDDNSHKYDGANSNCGGGWISDRSITNGECRDWGNPIGEMLFEAVRYFAGANAASTSYNYGDGSVDAGLGLPKASWNDPFAATGGFPWCSPAYNLILSDINPSYDGDEIPTTAFTTTAISSASSTAYSGDYSDLTNFNVVSAGESITAREGDIDGSSFYIGQAVGGDTDGAPTPKSVTSLGKIRGLSPMEPTKQGSYYSAAVSYWANNFDLFTNHPGTQSIKTLAVALASPLPEMKFDLDHNGTPDITFIPFAKSVHAWSGTGGNIDATKGKFQPTSTIVDYYVESQSADGNSGKFRVNFEDEEQGADHDKDFLVTYEYSITSAATPTLTITTAADRNEIRGDIEIHAGYIISGTQPDIKTNNDGTKTTKPKDGIYLDVRNNLDREGDQAYYLDTLGANDFPYPNNYRKVDDNDKGKNDKFVPNGSVTRTFTKSSTAGARILKSPLWYAAKWGSYDVDVSSAVPTGGSGDDAADPDGYFLVTNASTLKDKLEKALNKATKKKLAGNAVGLTSIALTGSNVAFNSYFETEYWNGELAAYRINSAGDIATTPIWSASSKLGNQSNATRKIFTLAYTRPNANSAYTTSKRDFVAPNSLAGSATGLSQGQISELLTGTIPGDDTNKTNYVAALVNYLRGVRTYESSNAPGMNVPFRTRKNVLGTIVHSTPVYGTNDSGSPFIITGANDGMVHVFNASTDSTGGNEIFGYVPSPVYRNLADYSRNSYNHKYYVDGDINVATVEDSNRVKRTIAVGSLGQGGQGIYALDLTSLDSVTADSNVKWEFTDKNDADMGYYSAAPSIVKMRFKVGAETEAKDRWVAIFGNGYNNKEGDGTSSTTGNAVIYIVDLFDGTLYKKLDSGVGANAANAPYTSNAMAQPLLISSSRGTVADRVYAGDLFGNVWKFDISSPDTANWKSALLDGTTAIPLYKTATGQPITTQITALPFTNGAQLLMFGTGKFIETSDKTVAGSTTQGIYAIKDANPLATITESSLVEQTLTGTTEVRTMTTTPVDWSTKNGWFIKLQTRDPVDNHGERVYLNPWASSPYLYVTTLQPNSDSCGFGGASWSMKINALTGTLLSATKGDPVVGETPVVAITGRPPETPPVPGDTPPPITAEQQAMINETAVSCKNNGMGNTVLYKLRKRSDGSVEKAVVQTQCNGLVSWQEVY